MDQGAPKTEEGESGKRPVQSLPGVGPKIAERLASLGIETCATSSSTSRAPIWTGTRQRASPDLAVGEEATVRCKLERIRVRPTRRRNLKVVEGVVVDAAGVEEKVVWFNQAHLAKLAPGTELLLHGTRDLAASRSRGTSSAALACTRSGSSPSTPRRRRCPRTASVRSSRQRCRSPAAFRDALPAELRVRERTAAPGRRASRPCTGPRACEDAEAARRAARARGAPHPAARLRPPPRGGRAGVERDGPRRGRRADRPVSARPSVRAHARGTGGCHRAIDAGISRESRPMQRLLQGDVGSGKTVVALYALLRAVERGRQGAP